MTEQQIVSLCNALDQAGIAFRRGEALSAHTSFRIGGPAAVFAMPASSDQLAECLRLCREAQVRRYLLCKGSNILFADEGFDGVVIAVGEGMDSIRVEDTRIVAGAGASLSRVCLAARDAGLTGLEFAYGIPGGVGGAVYMNAGAYGGEMKDVVSRVHCLDEEGNPHWLLPEQLAFGYRTSCFEHNGWTVDEVEFTLRPGSREEIAAAMEDYLNRRKTKQPLDKPSAGSAFKRPQGAFASALIDQCGLKGYQVGGAAISEKHAGFIVNLGGATCADVLAVANDVSRIVREKTGFVLEKEIRVVR